MEETITKSCALENGAQVAERETRQVRLLKFENIRRWKDGRDTYSKLFKKTDVLGMKEKNEKPK